MVRITYGGEALKKIVIAEMRWIPRNLGGLLAPQ